MKKLFILLVCLLPVLAQAQMETSVAGFIPLSGSGRIVYNFNPGWRFHRGDIKGAEAVRFDDTSWQVVSVPHTVELMPAEASGCRNYQGVAWYRKHFVIPQDMKGKEVSLHFEGAMGKQVIYLNGKRVQEHLGGYLPFTVQLTEQGVQPGDSCLLAVMTDNSDDKNFPPGKRQYTLDFAYHGGIYRDVWMIGKSSVAITDALEADKVAGGGVFVHFDNISGKKAEVYVDTEVHNSGKQTRTVAVETVLADAGDVPVKRVSQQVKLQAGESKTVRQQFAVRNPKLWSPDSPYLYRIQSRVKAGHEVLDGGVTRVGIRKAEFKGKDGFWLNGKPFGQLVGANRHQDFAYVGNALPNSQQWRDAKRLRDAGCTIIRVAHYPQDPVVMQMCDKLGLLTSVEIPIVNAITQSRAFMDNCVEQATEMVCQNYNYPSVIIWAYMNEVLLRPPFNPDNKKERAEYMKFLHQIASAVEAQIRSLDSERYTMLPCHSASQIYQEAGITELPMLLGFNLYNGWYGGNLGGFEEKLEELHKEFPHKPLLITEYGADVDTRIHSFSPVRFDFSCEFGSVYHEHYLPEILKRDYIVGAMVWNLNDFYSEARRNAMPHVNNKGLVSTDRERKDGYFLYQAYLKESPVLHIASKSWKNRAGASRDGKSCTQPLKVYTNADKVEVFLNGKSLGVYPVADKVVSVDIPFVNGKNVVDAVIEKEGREYRDQYVCDFKCVNVKNCFTEINVLLGARRYFEDRIAEMCWIPEQAYAEGSWGYIGGEVAPNKTRYGSLPASDTDILGTDQDPVFQTQRVGIEAFKADVPDGVYAVYLYWTELTSENKREALVYNLGNDVVREDYINRVFSVDINGVSVAKQLNIAEEYGSERAVIKKYIVPVSQGKGLVVRFGAVESVPILNAIRIVKEY